MSPEELKDRTKKYALRIVKVVRALPNTTEGRAIGNQLIRSGTSVGANYRASLRARSRAEFVSKLGIVIEETDESEFWLEIIVESGLLKEVLIKPLLKETNELIAIFVATCKSSKKSMRPNHKPKIINHKSGYVLLTSVLILGAIGAAIGVAVAMLGTDNTRAARFAAESDGALYAAESCVDRALQSIRDDSAHTGTDNYTVGSGSCSVVITDTGGDTRSIQATGTRGDSVRRVNVSISAISPAITVDNWEDVASF